MPRSILIPADLNARMEAMAERHNRRKSQVARETLEWYLDFWEQAQEVGERIVQQSLGAIRLDAKEMRVYGPPQPDNGVIDLNLWRQSRPRPIKTCSVDAGTIGGGDDGTL
jgi:predicted DNA-binding protein